MKAFLKISSSFLSVGLLVWVLTLTPVNRVQTDSAQRGSSGFTPSTAVDDLSITVGEPVTPTLTQAVRDLPPVSLELTLDREINPRMSLNSGNDNYNPPSGPDPLLATQAAAPDRAPDGFDTPLFSFNGQGFTGANPPDTVGDIGKDHYIQMVNGSGTVVSIYNKNSGALIQSFAFTSLGGCTTGGGDPVVLYDQLADRWFLSEFGAGSSLCILISQTPDPTGAYYSYQFTTPGFPDYPKYGVWPDAYYATANESSPSVYALDRTAMLSGAAATSQRFTAPDLAGFGFQALTPSDLDGMTPPPAGAPNYIMRHVDTEAHSVPGFPATDLLEVWAFDVDWVTPGNSTFSKIADVQTAEFDSALCGLTSFFCMGMPGVAQGSGSSLDPLREVIMNRLAYRNFGDHETLVGNFVTDIGSDIGGVRWFELRKVGAGAWTLYQEGTYAPTTNDNRWMGGIAMDGSGNIALGYNVSSQTVYPSLRYVGRLASDPLGTLPQGEYTLVNGTAVNGSNRYGDYSAMGIDPVDDCTFWFTGQWNGASQWSTRIGAFKFDACGANDFTLSAEPATQNICSATDAVYDITVGQVLTFADPVTLSVSGEPAGTTTSFTVNPVNPPGTSALTIGNTGAASAGSYNLNIVGIAPTSTHTTTVQLNLFDALASAPVPQTPANGAVDVSVQPTFTWNAVSGSESYLIEIATDNAFSNVVISATTTANTYIPASSLSGSTFYFWRVTASNICGDSAPSATFAFVTEALTLVCNSTPITIPNSGAGVPYPSDISLSGAGTILSDVNVHLLDLSHTYPDDLDLMVVGPQGQNLIIMSDVGAGTDAVAVDLILDDAAPTPLPNSTALTSGTYQPANYGTGDPFPAPAPTPSAATTLSTFDGTDPNGVWSLYLVDDAGGDAGSLAGGWCLEIVASGGDEPSLTLTQTVGTDPLVYPTTDAITVTSGMSVTYFYVVQNTGNITLPLHTLQDTQFGTVIGPDYAYDLAPNEVLTVTASAVMTQSVTNTSIWFATDNGTNTATANDSATVNVLSPAITLTKTVGTVPGVCATTDEIEVDSGTVVYYCYTVENTGDVALALHDLEDDQLGILLDGFAYDLAPGASVDTVTAGLTLSATITSTITNTAVWTAYNDVDVSASASAIATVGVNTYYIYLPTIMKP